jgi:hypothetical protein
LNSGGFSPHTEGQDLYAGYLGEVARIDVGSGSQVWSVSVTSSGSDQPVQDVLGGSGQYIYTSEGSALTVRSKSDGSLYRQSAAGASGATNMAIDFSETNLYYTFTFGGAEFYDIPAETNRLLVNESLDSVASARLIAQESTTAVNNDLLVSGTLDLSTLNGSRSESFSTVFGSETINIPSNHNDLERSMFESETSGITKTTDVTFQLRVVLPNANIEDTDQDTATYSVTNS